MISIGTVSLADADAKLSGETSGDQVGYSVSGGGDASGDGVPDLLIGATYAGRGGTGYLVLGPVSGARSLGDADARLLAEADSDSAGRSVSLAEDMNGDGLDDMLVGAPQTETVTKYAGDVYMLLASSF